MERKLWTREELVLALNLYLMDISVMLTPCFGDIDPPCSKWFKEQRT